MKTLFPYSLDMNAAGLSSMVGYRIDAGPAAHVWPENSDLLTRQVLETQFTESFPAIIDLQCYEHGRSDYVPSEAHMFPSTTKKPMDGLWDGFGFVHLTARHPSSFLISQRGFVFCSRLTLHHKPTRTTIDSHLPLSIQDLDTVFPRDLEKLKIHLVNHGVAWKESVVTLLKGKPSFKSEDALETDDSIKLVFETLKRSGFECHQVIECYDDDQPFLLDTQTGLQRIDTSNLSAVYVKIQDKLQMLFDLCFDTLEQLRLGRMEDAWHSQTILEIAESLINKLNRTQINLDFFPEHGERRWEALRLTLFKLQNLETKLLQSISFEELSADVMLLKE